MPRKARILVPDCPHHIVQRGHNRNAVFVADEDFQFYLENLLEWNEKLRVKVYAWCLMTRRVHLIVEPTRNTETVSELMKRISGRQAAYTNKLEGRCGSLWQGRFKASPIQRDEYLLLCLRYVELNPVRAGMVDRAEDYPWSSFRARSNNAQGVSASPGLLDLDAGYLGLGTTPMQRLSRYRAFLSSPSSPAVQSLIRAGVQRGQLTGSHRFADEVERRIGIRIEQRGRGRPRREQ